MNRPRIGALLALAALTLVSACGVKGDLERPDPLWNSEEAIRRECERQLENNEPQDPRCAQYQSGAQPSDSTPQ
jgi:predicted small lipoprotein YifL